MPPTLLCSAHLLLEVEHTWGTDTKTWLDFDHYTPKDLAAMLDTKNYKVVQFSWQEKRQDLFAGIADASRPLARAGADGSAGSGSGTTALMHPAPHPAGGDIETQHFIVGIDPKTGAIRRLRNKKSRREWASGDHPLALFSYQTLSQQDYSHFFDSYVVSNEDWAKKDFGKPNIERFGAESREWLPSLADLQVEEDQQGHRLLARLEINDAEALRSGRAAFPQKDVSGNAAAQSRAGHPFEFFLVPKAGNAPSRGSVADFSSRLPPIRRAGRWRNRASRYRLWTLSAPAIVICTRSRRDSATRMRRGPSLWRLWTRRWSH